MSYDDKDNKEESAFDNFFLPEPDESLLEGETKNLRKEILDTIGEEWLHAKNDALGGKSPDNLIGTPAEFRVRAMWRSFMAAALS